MSWLAVSWLTRTVDPDRVRPQAYSVRRPRLIPPLSSRPVLPRVLPWLSSSSPVSGKKRFADQKKSALVVFFIADDCEKKYL